MTKAADIEVQDLVKYDWFVAGAFATEAMQKTNDAHAAAHKVHKALMKEFGAEGMSLVGYRFSGFAFPDEKSVPEGWRMVDRKGSKKYYCPPRRKKVDRELYDRLTAVPQVTMSHFAGQFGGTVLCQDGHRSFLRGPTICEIAGVEYFGLPRGHGVEAFKNIPDDIEPVSLGNMITRLEEALAKEEAA